MHVYLYPRPPYRWQNRTKQNRVHLGKISACVPPILNSRVRNRVRFRVLVRFRVRIRVKDSVRIGIVFIIIQWRGAGGDISLHPSIHTYTRIHEGIHTYLITYIHT